MIYGTTNSSGSHRPSFDCDGCASLRWLEQLKHSLIVLLFAALAIIPFISIGDVFQVSEGREGVVVGEILRTGEYILPLRHGEVVPSKPPLFHWLSAFLYQVGEGLTYDEFYLRLPSAIGAILTVWALFLFMLNLSGPLSAYSCAAVLLTTNCFACLARDGRVDMLFSFFVTAGVLLWLHPQIKAKCCGDQQAPKLGRKGYSIGVLLGLAVLTKGPLGIVLPFVFVVPLSFLWWSWIGLKRLFHPGLVLSIVIPFPWYAQSVLKGSSAFVQRQLIFENIGRFFGGEGITVKPFWFYLAQIWKQGAPWSAVLIVVLFLLWQKRGKLADLGKQLVAKQLLVAALFWLGSFVTFFSLSAGKRGGYLLLITPALSIAIVSAIRLLAAINTDRDPKLLAKLAWSGVIVSAIITLFVVSVNFGLQRGYGFGIPDLLISAIQKVEPFHKSLLLTLIVLCLVCSLGAFHRYYHSRRAVYVGVIWFWTLLLIITGVQGLGLAIKGETHGYKDAAEQLAQVIASDQKPVFLKTTKDESFDGLFFYYPQRIKLSEFKNVENQNIIYITRNKWLAQLDWLDRKAMKTLLVAGRLKDEEEDRLVVFTLQ